jgi:hypothetical protein
MTKTKHSPKDIAVAWVKHSATKQGGMSELDNSEEYFWAHLELDELIDKDPESALNVILLVESLNPSDQILSHLAAGPLETLLARRGKYVINEVERIAAGNYGLRKLLSGVWRNKIDPEVWGRIQRLIKE